MMVDRFLSDGHEAVTFAHDLGPCCCCECGAPDGVAVRNVVMLDQLAPTPGTGWGCVVCDLPADGAIYVCCDACFEAQRPPAYACRGEPLKGGRVPIELLVGHHEHNLTRHAPEPAYARPPGPFATNAEGDDSTLH